MIRSVDPFGVRSRESAVQTYGTDNRAAITIGTIFTGILLASKNQMGYLLIGDDL